MKGRHICKGRGNTIGAHSIFSIFPYIIAHAWTTTRVLTEIQDSTSGLPIVVAVITPPKFLGIFKILGTPPLTQATRVSIRPQPVALPTTLNKVHPLTFHKLHSHIMFCLKYRP